MNAEEVHGREDDWSAQGGIVWIFCAIKEADKKRISWAATGPGRIGGYFRSRGHMHRTESSRHAHHRFSISAMNGSCSSAAGDLPATGR